MTENPTQHRTLSRRKAVAWGAGIIGIAIECGVAYDAITAPKEESSSAYNPGSATSVLPKDEAIGEQNRLTDSRTILRTTGALVGVALIAYCLDELTGK